MNSFIIPEGMTVTGSFYSPVSGQIAGSVNGDLQVNGSLQVLESAVVTGNVKATEVELWGRVTGFIQCSGKIILHKASFVKGNINTPDIQVEEGAIVDGIVYKAAQNAATTAQEAGSAVRIINEPVYGMPKEPPGQETASERDKRSTWF
jgi:cytoskeletal protein CcmA (bactofilin family)